MESKIKLAEVCNIIMGQSPPGYSYNKFHDGIPLLNGPTEFGNFHPTPKTWTKQPTKRCNIGDLLFCVRGTTTGRMNWANEEYCIGRGICALGGKTSRDTKFIYYSIIQHLDRLLSSARGTVFLNLTKIDIENFEIPWFNDSTRYRIVEILDKLDEKIKTLYKINVNLEKMIQSIFRSWFVDFDGQTEFVDSELGEIPNGWKIMALGDVVDFKYGKSLKEESRMKGSIPVYGSNGIVGYHDEALVEGPGIIIGRKGTPGTVTFCMEDFFPIDTAFYIELKNHNHISSIYYLYNELSNQNLPLLISDSAVPGLNRNIAYQNKILIPFPEIVNKFDDLVIMFYNLMHINHKICNVLSEIRDILLPKLMSGEIKV